jgi:hypothetical protein
MGLFVLVLVLPIWCCFRRDSVDRRSGIDVFQPGTVAAGFFYLYVVVPALNVWLGLDYRSLWSDPVWPAAPLFRFTLALWILGLVAFRFGYAGGRPVRGRLSGSRGAPPNTSGALPPWPRWATAVAVGMLAIGLPFRLYHLAAFGGLRPDILLFLSPGYQVESGVTITGVPTFFEAFFNWGALLLLYRAVLTNRHRLLAFVILGVALSLAYLLSGKRSAVAPFLLYPLVWWHYLKHRLAVRRAVVYFAIGLTVMSGLLFLRSVGPLLADQGFRLSAVPADIALAPVRFYLNSPDLNVFDMTMLAVQDQGTLLKEAGGPLVGALQYNLVGALYVIPRFLWPGKPAFVDLGAIFYQHSVGGREDVGFSVGIVGSCYLFGGLIGVVVGMWLIGRVLRFVYFALRPWGRHPCSVFLYGIALWMTFHLLRFGQLGGTMAYFYQFELAGVAAALVALRGGTPSDRRITGSVPT